MISMQRCKDAGQDRTLLLHGCELQRQHGCIQRVVRCIAQAKPNIRPRKPRGTCPGPGCILTAATAQRNSKVGLVTSARCPTPAFSAGRHDRSEA